MTGSGDETDDAAIDRRLRALGVSADEIVERFVRASGPGGQKVNKTSSAVYLKHEPTGVEVKAQSTRSQAQNRLDARLRLVEALESRVAAARREARQLAEKRRRRHRKRPAGVQRRIVAGKRQRGETKRRRRRVRTTDEP